ncbi:MAG: GGDEF and EAL domain-containing protein [Oscillospiraceae bacterium]|nr:GGDEF and EAL domain-containing protein [Oscillospiraceae bacterium]
MKQYQFPDEQRALMEHMRTPFAVYQFIEKRVVTLILSEGFCRLFGYRNRAEAYFDMDHNMYKDTHPDDVARIAEVAYRFAVEAGDYNVSYRSRCADGSGYRVIHARGEHVFTDDGVRLAYVWYMDEGVFVPESSPQEDSAVTQRVVTCACDADIDARYDSLTGLPNMTYFFELAAAERDRILAGGVQPALLFIDLSGMKYYNRRFGFAEGNALLRAFGRLLAIYFGNENCSRFGQDHFAVVVPTEELDRQLGRLFQDCRELNGGKSLSVRTGVYRMTERGTDISIACDRAKLACDALRNVYVSCIKYFDVNMQEDADRRRYILGSFDRALEEGWIKVFYQPIVRAVNGRICDEEALARWDDPEKGLLSPAEFVPILESTRLIYKLDLYVLDRVLEKLRRQLAEGISPVPQSVNLSRADFEVCDIVEEIRSRVDASGVGRDMVTIEITESIVGSDFDFMKEQIQRFRTLGFAVWMDDFGSGYSSLDVLQSVRFDLIKFDMSFMRKFDSAEGGDVILTELTKMATAMGIDTVCEGVETEEQIRFLREIGCSKLQGYYFAKPMPLDALFRHQEFGARLAFENPAESSYYATIGRTDLYDLSVLASDDRDAFRNFFDSLPVALLEVRNDRAYLLRSNRSYREVIRRRLGVELREGDALSFPPFDRTTYVRTLLNRCRHGEGCSLLEERLDKNDTASLFARYLAENPVSGAAAIAIGILSVNGPKGASYADIARALASDYFDLFYVDLETEKFIAYTSDVGGEELAAERHGEDFFASARHDAPQLLHPEDCGAFVAQFTRENVLHALDTRGAFTTSYRLLRNGVPEYVNMKVTRMHPDESHIIIGVSSINEQMRLKEEAERVARDKLSYSRISALMGEVVCLYIIDPKTERYSEYSSNEDYKSFGLESEGEAFFSTARENGVRTVCADDLLMYLKRFTLDNVLREIAVKGRFSMDYHLMFAGEPRRVVLRAAVSRESDGEKLLVGLCAFDGNERQEPVRS